MSINHISLIEIIDDNDTIFLFHKGMINSVIADDNSISVNLSTDQMLYMNFKTLSSVHVAYNVIKDSLCQP